MRIPAKSLLQEQFLFDLDEGAVDWERFPIREMVARGWIKEKVTDVRCQAKDVMHRFFAPLGKGWAPNALYKQTHYYLRSARQMDFYALAAWNAAYVYAFNTPPSVEFEPQALTSEFMHELAYLSTLTDGPRHAMII